MNQQSQDSGELIELRRRLHQRPEPAWREYCTTNIIVEELEKRNVDEIFVGTDALEIESRFDVPCDEQLQDWHDRARQNEVREDVLEMTAGGNTGVVGVVRNGDGPIVGIRVDIDGLKIDESTSESHRPVAEGYHSQHHGFMHACAHDANTTIGIGILDTIQSSDFQGTLKVFFQPASEVEGGGKAMAESPHIDDVDYLIMVNTGMGYSTGELVAGVDEIHAIERRQVGFSGESAHAGRSPNKGRNAIQAVATATENIYAIPRHADGMTRVNVGIVSGGTASNVIAEQAVIEVDLRGETTSLLDFICDRADNVIEGAAIIHSCEFTSETIGQAPSSYSDEELVDRFESIFREHPQVTTVHRRESFGTGDDGAWLMNAVRDRGGKATHIINGANLASDHHTSSFEIDEQSLAIGVNALTTGLESID